MLYCEKPLAKDMASLRECIDAVKKPAGSSARWAPRDEAAPRATGCREFYKSGGLGKVTRIEQRRNGPQPYWYRRVEAARQEPTSSGSEFLMDAPRIAPSTPFSSPVGWDTANFPTDQSLSSRRTILDMIHYVTGCKPPGQSCVAQGGTFTWKDDHAFTAPGRGRVESGSIPKISWSATPPATETPVARATASSAPGATLDMSGDTPIVSGEGAIDGENRIPRKSGVDLVDTPEHFLNWLQCLRSGKTPNADIDSGYQHSVASIMSVLAMDTGRRHLYDAKSRDVVPG